jgi:ribosomal protein L40E
MTKETLGYVRLEWTCPNCDSRNPGPAKSCSNCGAAQPEDVEFEQPAQEELVADEKEVARAKAGPDVHCAFCGARNPAEVESCTQCGADLREAEARAHGEVLGAHRDRPAKQVPCPSCGTLNPATALECSQCGASTARPERRVSRQPAASRPSGCGVPLVAIVGGIILLVAVFFILSRRTTDVFGRVQDVTWTRTIAIMGFGPVAHQDWVDEIPSDAAVGTCTQKVHHVQDNPVPNADKVCGTPYTVDTGSGYGQVVQDCQYQVYADWCQYNVNEWQQIDTLVLNGDDLAPRWPFAQLAADQQEGERKESYKILFDVDGKTRTYSTSDPTEFDRFEIGSRWKLKVNALGGVVSVEPAD